MPHMMTMSVNIIDLVTSIIMQLCEKDLLLSSWSGLLKRYGTIIIRMRKEVSRDSFYRQN